MKVVTYGGTIRAHHTEYRQALENGECTPFVLPQHIASYFFLICCLMFSIGRSTIVRWCTFLTIILHSFLVMRYSRSLGLAHGVTIGIASSWSVLVAIDLLFIRHPANHFRRVTCRKSVPTVPVRTNDIRHQRPETSLEWQPMPRSVLQRLFWYMDLLGSMRLLHWSAQHNPDKQDCLHKHVSVCHRNTLSVKRCIFRLCVIYIAIDVLKEVVAMDPYFWGHTQASIPPQVEFLITSPFLTRGYRLSVAFVLLYLAIALVTESGQLVFLHILGPNVAGAWGQDWAYKPQYGSLSSIYAHGLRGFWGTTWHQMFRHMLTSSSNKMVLLLPLDTQGPTAKALRLSFPFVISGIIHGCGSYTLWGDTRPLQAILFFLLQPLGIAVQSLHGLAVDRVIGDSILGVHVNGISNVISTAIFFLLTFPLLADDFAKGGLWLSEPFPISVMQSLRLGSTQRAHSLWLNSGIGWYPGRHWWQAGIAVWTWSCEVWCHWIWRLHRLYCVGEWTISI